MTLKRLELIGFKSFGKKTEFLFTTPVTGIVGPNGSGKSNVVEAIRFVLGEQSMKSLRGRGGVDLIFKGAKNAGSASRASVTIIFDNAKRKFKFSNSGENSISVDFDEIAITREVFADGVNSYKINGTDVRLKDVIDLLASVHIGASGHHIISQGEADRILSARAKDRREMIEDALGLKVYQYRIRESERKLEKSRENMREVQSLRRELAPHISFLKKQVEKIERASALREEVQSMYARYLPGMRAYLIREQAELDGEKKKLLDEKRIHEKSVEAHEQKMSHADSLETVEQKQKAKVIETRRKVSDERDALLRVLGRLEGALELVRKQSPTETKEQKAIAFEKVSSLCDEILQTEEIGIVKQIVRSFKASITEHAVDQKLPKANIEAIEKELSDAQEKYRELLRQEEIIDSELKSLDEKIKNETVSARDEERAYYEAKQKFERVLADLRSIEFKYERHIEENNLFDSEIKEGAALIGPEIGKLLQGESESLKPEERADLKRRLERAKIKLEEIGGGSGSDILKEYEEATNRDTFLNKELADITEAISGLEQLISELKQKLEHEFTGGISSINSRFKEFFQAMFGGGDAFLEVTHEERRKKKQDENDEEMIDELTDPNSIERGVEVHVTLPQKKVRDLAMLSGGERSLTSIALLFAISQVNPPPFLVLDETDAALDEANSRKYGNMIEKLSSISELVVVTHNRETMSRAGVLYGITIGSDSVSKILSIKLDEAGKYAK